MSASGADCSGKRQLEHAQTRFAVRVKGILAFAPEEAFRLMQRFEWHYTPEHGSWLNMAEIELSILARQCLSRRMNRKQLEQEVPAWEARRNTMQGRINWHFTVADARVKLRRLYPIQDD